MGNKQRPIMSGMENNPEAFRIPPDGTNAALARDPASVFFTLPEIARVFGMTLPELRRELSDGRLKATGTPNDTGGYHNIAVPFPMLVAWMVATGRELPQ